MVHRSSRWSCRSRRRSYRRSRRRSCRSSNSLGPSGPIGPLDGPIGPGPDLNNPDVIPPPESPNVPPPEIPTSAPSPDSGGGGGGGGGGLSGGTPNRVDQSLFGYDLPNFVGINYQAPARNELDRIIRESLFEGMV